MQGKGGLTAGFGPVDLGDSASWQATHAKRHIECERSCRDRFDGLAVALAQAHNRTLAEGLFDLGKRRFKCSLTLWGGGFAGVSVSFNCCRRWCFLTLVLPVYYKTCVYWYSILENQYRARNFIASPILNECSPSRT